MQITGSDTSLTSHSLVCGETYGLRKRCPFRTSANHVASRWRSANSGQASSSAHHAVDLSSNPGVHEVEDRLRRNWISFADGNTPWAPDEKYAVGPQSERGLWKERDYADHRRTACFESLRHISRTSFGSIFGPSTGGRNSLLT